MSAQGRRYGLAAMVATARAAMPSSRPTKPIRSFVVALTLIVSGGSPTQSPIDACIAASFASWVTESPLTGAGGGGFMLVHRARDAGKILWLGLSDWDAAKIARQPVWSTRKACPWGVRQRCRPGPTTRSVEVDVDIFPMGDPA